MKSARDNMAWRIQDIICCVHKISHMHGIINLTFQMICCVHKYSEYEMYYSISYDLCKIFPAHESLCCAHVNECRVLEII